MNSSKRILLFLKDAINRDKIERVANQNHVRIDNISSTQYLESLGALAGISGMKTTGKKYLGQIPETEALVFCGFNPSDMESFLDLLKKEGVPTTILKAMITPTNVFWTPLELLKELQSEHKSLKQS